MRCLRRLSLELCAFSLCCACRALIHRHPKQTTSPIRSNALLASACPGSLGARQPRFQPESQTCIALQQNRCTCSGPRSGQYRCSQGNAPRPHLIGLAPPRGPACPRDTTPPDGKAASPACSSRGLEQTLQRSAEHRANRRRALDHHVRKAEAGLLFWAKRLARAEHSWPRPTCFSQTRQDHIALDATA